METQYPAVRLRDMAVHERPQERLEKHGPKVLSDAELIAMLLRSGSRDLDVLAISQLMITQGGSLAGLLRWSASDFKKIKGVGHVKALQLITVMEVASRVLVQSQGDAAPILDQPERVYQYLLPQSASLDVEKFWVLCLNRKNRLIRMEEVTSGTATSSLVHPREVFRAAIRHGATAIICAHNHPSGDPTPSSSDIQVTRQLRSSAETLGIDLLDHIVIGQGYLDPRGAGFYSFARGGIL